MDVYNKKMKRDSVTFDQSPSIHDEANAKLNYQILLNGYLELQKEYVSRKRKLQAAKQKRDTVLAEVRYLRRRRKYLLKSQAPDMSMVPLHLPTSRTLKRKRNHSTSGAAQESFDQVLISDSHVKNEEAKENESVHKENVQLTKKLKNRIVGDTGVGKRKISRSSHLGLDH